METENNLTNVSETYCYHAFISRCGNSLLPELQGCKAKKETVNEDCDNEQHLSAFKQSPPKWSVRVDGIQNNAANQSNGWADQ